MPSRNVVKVDVSESFYHVYARGSNRQQIFLDEDDYSYFMQLFARYLSAKPCTSKTGVKYLHYCGQIELLAFCLMSNHFHLLVYQHEKSAMSKLMKSVMTSYGRYFNLKYKRSGSLYESTYKASRITSDSYLQHISRYIHLNPRYWRRYPYSSLPHYLNSIQPEWLHIGKIMGLFSDPVDYKLFLEDYENQKQILDDLKYALADT